jgi:membrane-associated phospholipid phosphatase
MGHGRGAEFGAGFVTSEVITQGFKAGLGKSSINRRPSDVDHGTPSVHTALAVFGATSLARKCAPDLPVKGGLAFGAAAVVAASRVDAGKHTVGQGNLWIILPMASRPIFPQAGSPLAIR